jgi:hypothetical protein
MSDTIQITAPKQPTLRDDDVCRAVAKKLLPTLSLDIDPSDIDGHEDDLADVLSTGDDGYGTAKRLDCDHNWDGIDTQMVQALDDAVFDLEAELKTQTKAWIEKWGIEPTFALDDTANWRGMEGVITRIDDHGTAILTTEGHKPGNGYLVPWSDLGIRATLGQLEIAVPA